MGELITWTKGFKCEGVEGEVCTTYIGNCHVFQGKEFSWAITMRVRIKFINTMWLNDSYWECAESLLEMLFHLYFRIMVTKGRKIFQIKKTAPY